MEKICNVTNMPEKYCAHCLSLKKSKISNEINGYSIKESYYMKNPLIEILYNGGPVNDFDSNFTFGISKAKMIMECFEEIEEFASLPFEKLRKKFKKEKLVGNSVIRIDYQPEFEIRGKVLRIPYIKLTKAGISIGFGQKKAEAIIELKELIKKWIKSNSKI